MSHTPEPWTYGKDDWDYYYLVEAVQKPEGILCEGLDEDDAKRIVQCVNACAGIEDPAKYIADLKAQLDALVMVCQNIAVENAGLIDNINTLKSRLDLAVKALEDIGNEFLGQKGYESLATYLDTLTQIKGGADDNG